MKQLKYKEYQKNMLYYNQKHNIKFCRHNLKIYIFFKISKYLMKGVFINKNYKIKNLKKFINNLNVNDYKNFYNIMKQENLYLDLEFFNINNYIIK